MQAPTQLHTSTQLHTFPFSQRTARELSRLIDPTGFGTVKRYYRDSWSEIKDMVIVEEEYNLEDSGGLLRLLPEKLPHPGHTRRPVRSRRDTLRR